MVAGDTMLSSKHTQRRLQMSVDVAATAFKPPEPPWPASASDPYPVGSDPGSDPGYSPYPSDPYPSDPYSPVSRTWVGGHDDHSATFADNWSPSGAPQSGDMLNFPQGSVDVQGYDLKGDTLYVGKVGEPSQNTVNLSHQAQVSVFWL